MDLISDLNQFLLWSQTPLGAVAVGNLTAAAATGTALAIVGSIRSIPRRFERWLERRAARL
ncbi:hypothetical protein SA2016_4133 (plasmid) [Sinomonas atrocyanea]|uniref:Uncharacterized protein n=1 Tax=Sinomonas atrocyanea TaxID=37927 RepID=A0A127A839_9MICC|nr:hypothetical protein [Sinomonas atrocyanea]AMM34785.1 hypothetical protein SA2016_4133 [Sinomonas atrocyanea]GEB64638.1 hypothetical protein SAT01_20860 [Sinomonas atrocyanea]GGG72090.1 hypothetical protein GCM10007172_25640 [Sinomonas atrocyanea]